MTIKDPVHVVTNGIARPVRIVTSGISDPVDIRTDGKGDPVRVVTEGMSDPVRVAGGVWPPVPAIPWYRAGNIPLANCKGIYKPKGASSIANSYSNIINPGTNNMTSLTPPTWDAVNGWKFDETLSQYLTCGIIPVIGWSAFIKYTHLGGLADYGYLFAGSGVGKNLGVERDTIASGKLWYGNQSWNIGTVVAPNTGVAGVAGQQGYLNGVADGGPIGIAGGAYGAQNIACTHNGITYTNFGTLYVQAFVMYDIVLTLPQIVALRDAMLAL